MVKKLRNRTVIENLQHNDEAKAHREIDAGFPIDMTKLGSVPSAEIFIGVSSTVRIVNESGATMYVKTGDTALAAPTSMSNGLAIFNNTIIFINTADKEYIRFSGVSADAQYAVALEDTSQEN